MFTRVRLFPLIVVLVFGSLQLTAGDNETAKTIIELAGTRNGLCLHIGCGRTESPDLCVAIAAQSDMVVHGLALNEASLERTRKSIQAKEISTRVVAELIPLRPLPFVSDFANIIVIEDLKAVEAAGVTNAELTRVLAPNGALVVNTNGKWTKTVKPRTSEMDDWTHPRHGADGNMVSTDKLVKFPLGFRWIDGLPMNVNRWAACRGWVIANGRCYTLSSNEFENFNNKVKTHYLSARDAFNGLPLWKIDCGTTDDGAYLTYENAAPIAADDKCVYAVQKDKIIGVDGATGQIVNTFDTKYPAARLLLLNNTLVAACWEGKDASKADFDKNSLWATWTNKSGVGTVQAFEADTGRQKWALPNSAEQIVAADGAIYVLTQAGNPPTERTVIAMDLQTGKERWRMAHAEIGSIPDLQLNVAGYGYVVVAKRKEKAISVLSAETGKVLWQIKPANGLWTPVVDGLLWHGNKKYDPLTGEVKATVPWSPGDQGCTPSAVVGSILTRTRGCSYTELPESNEPGGKAKNIQFSAARGACMEGMVPANGMFYTAQNNCRCAPAQVYGFLAIGPAGSVPSPADYQKARTVEKGPAFGAAKNEANAEDWPSYRHDPERSATTSVKVPETFAEIWRAPIAKLPDGKVADALKPRLASPVTAPVSAGGLVFICGSDEGSVTAIDAASGKKVWTELLGGRIDSPPTIVNGLCLIGCHDGFVHALRANDGKLAYRIRVAPDEKRMLAYGEVESVWPVIGTVLVHDNVAYANAGRTSESDGGIAVVAFNPATGEQLWGRSIGEGALRQNDLLCVRDNAIGWHHLRLDPKTGKDNPPAAVPKEWSQGGILDGTWTIMGRRRSGNAFTSGKTTADLMSSNSTLIVTNKNAIGKDDEKPRWSIPVPGGCQVEALALCGNVAVFAGRFRDAAPGKTAGVVFTVSLTDGKKITEVQLDSAPTYDGLIVARGQIFVSLQNGSLICLGKK